MDFTLNSDQSAIADALDKLAAQFTTVPTEFHGFALVGEELERELEAGQYFDIAAIPELGTLAAALAVERLARLPCTAEIALSMLLLVWQVNVLTAVLTFASLSGYAIVYTVCLKRARPP